MPDRHTNSRAFVGKALDGSAEGAFELMVRQKLAVALTNNRLTNIASRQDVSQEPCVPAKHATTSVAALYPYRWSCMRHVYILRPSTVLYWKAAFRHEKTITACSIVAPTQTFSHKAHHGGSYERGAKNTTPPQATEPHSTAQNLATFRKEIPQHTPNKRHKACSPALTRSAFQLAHQIA